MLMLIVCIFSKMSKNIVTKILIDYDLYLKYKKYEEIVLQQEKQTKKELEITEPKSEPLPEDPANSASSTSEITQEGSGTKNDISKTEIISYINQAIHEKLSEIKDILQNNQFGNGSSDLTPSAIEYVKNEHLPPISNSEDLKKSVPHDFYDKEELIKSVQPVFQIKARNLLNALDENPLEINFSTKGEVFIDNNSIPNANIFKIFPELFVKKTVKPLPGLSEVVTKIASLGLGHFINRGITKGLKRTLNSSHNFEELNQQIKKTKSWWFIGS